MTDFDVLIAGSGPAGCATALSLAAFAPELRVGLIAAPEKGEERIGETVPPQISPVLVHLGLWDAFSRGGHCPSYRTMAAWGDSQLGGNEFLLHAHQVGWRLDRPAFDRMLVEAASARVAAFIQAKVVSLARETGDWRVSLFDGTRPTADFWWMPPARRGVGPSLRVAAGEHRSPSRLLAPRGITQRRYRRLDDRELCRGLVVHGGDPQWRSRDCLHDGRRSRATARAVFRARFYAPFCRNLSRAKSRDS